MSGNKTFGFMAVTAAFTLGLASSGLAQESEIELERILVTPSRSGQLINKTAGSVSVITQKEIQNLNKQKIIDVLRSAEGLIVRDWYGNGSKASVDIRGFGEQANLNVLVLVDGRRTNQVDLSGVDWTQIPLDQVEKIEIIRGGSGSVLYGDNASSGVINIITKTGKGKPHADILAKYGSYDFNLQKASFSGAASGLSYLFSGSREGTHGYRNNSFFKSKDFFSKLNYEVTEKTDLRFSSGYHKSSYGLPASLKQPVIDQFNRRYARKSDRANDTDYYFVLGGGHDLEKWGDFDMDASYRRKRTNSYFPTDGLNTLRSRIRTLGVTPKYSLDNPVFSRKNKLVAGFDFYLADYSADAYSASTDVLQTFTDTNKISLAGYLQDEFSLFDRLNLVGGFRYETARFEFDYHDNSGWNPDIDENKRHTQRAFNGGAVYNYAQDSSAFFNISRSFRFPQVDEFTFNDAFWQQQLNTSLKPQHSLNFEFGARHRFTQGLSANLSLFRMKVKDELYFNSTGGPSGFGQNLNYDKTLHEGVEFGFDSGFRKKIFLFGNYTYTKAIFVDGENDDKEIPLVPRHKGSVGLRLMLPKNFAFNLMGTYVGERYFLNDQANASSRLNGYMTMDMNISYSFKCLNAVFGINNLLNKYYSEYAGVDLAVDGQKFYYPSPGRNYTLKLEYKF
ncbi:MAG: TonB-dependent receptor [Candidatus Omnitrophica bacterium]|nr:TonB-dependent receptor [Candidatus Omnitrophota bacterium]